jgi:hypothetical protein
VIRFPRFVVVTLCEISVSSRTFLTRIYQIFSFFFHVGDSREATSGKFERRVVTLSIKYSNFGLRRAQFEGSGLARCGTAPAKSLRQRTRVCVRYTDFGRIPKCCVKTTCSLLRGKLANTVETNLHQDLTNRAYIAHTLSIVRERMLPLGWNR